MFLGMMVGMTSQSAVADILYSNGPANDNYTAWPLGGNYVTANSFTLSQSSTVSGVDFNAWLYPGDTLSTIDYAIIEATNVTDPNFPFDGTILSSGTVSPTDTFLESNLYLYGIYDEGFFISGLNLSAGTYYLELSNAVTPNGDESFWDIKNGPSVAYSLSNGNLNDAGGNPGSNSMTFEIDGTTTSVTPEPSSFLLLGSGVLGLAGLVKRKLRVQVPQNAAI